MINFIDVRYSNELHIQQYIWTEIYLVFQTPSINFLCDHYDVN